MFNFLKNNDSMKTLSSYSKVLGFTQLCLFVGGLFFLTLAGILDWSMPAHSLQYYYGVTDVITWLMIALWFWLIYRSFAPPKLPLSVLCIAVAACLIKCALDANIYLLVGTTATGIMKWISEIAFLISFLWLWKEYCTPAKIYVSIFTFMPLIANLCRLCAHHTNMGPTYISLFGLLDALSLFFGIAFFLRFAKQLKRSQI